VAAPVRTLVDILEDTARAFPDAPAIDDGDTTISYSELLDNIDEGARWLSRHGVCAGDRVGVRMPSGSYSLYAAILSVIAAGAAYVPVDVDDPDERAELVFS
jgi:non-ribosomal peptide synthetase component F